MAQIDPYTPSRPYYECTDCGFRDVGDSIAFCPDCGGRTQNIAVPRE